MAIVAYSRLRMLWGAFDWQAGSENPYTSAQTTSGGTTAHGAAGEVGVRRCIVTIDRTNVIAGADPAAMHFDFLNFTSGTPDDTWTTGDYTTLEGLLDTFFTSLVVFLGTGHRVTQYAWYRAGAGITAPNPAERTLVKSTPISGSGTVIHPPQVACSLTFRTAVRKSWGRTYFPWPTQATAANGQLSSANVDSMYNNLNTLVTGAASNDFALVVTSRTLSAALVVEKIEVDSNLDVIRRRRWKTSTFRHIS